MAKTRHPRNPKHPEQFLNEPFPAIPTEIMLAMLEALVEIAPRKAVDAITLSRSLKPFIEGLLYRTISLTSKRQLSSFISLIRSGSRPLSFYQDRIRHVCVTEQPTYEQAAIILSVCRTNIHSLAFRTLLDSKSAPQLDTTAFHSSLTTLRPKRLSIWLDRLDVNCPFGLDWLQQLTHLHIFITSSSHSRSQFNDTVLSHMPQLTHLSYIDRFSGGALLASFVSSLRLSPRFSVCLIWVYSSPGPSWIADDHDPRIVLLFHGKTAWERDGGKLKEAPDSVLVRHPMEPSNFIHDWGLKTSSRPDMWELAEEKVEYQRRLRLLKANERDAVVIES
ncbi:hypothetical protein C8J56DRAFT_1051365 [Mycena floridula]|nr:hypothetical protein C8J56DRAFT_1051365 [Mycena floridula]